MRFCCLPHCRSTHRTDKQSQPQLRTLSRDELDVIKVLTRQENAWNDGNLDGYIQAFKDSPDLLFVGRSISRGYAGMAADYRHGYPSKDAMGSLTYSGLEPHILDEHFAVVVGHFHLERTKKNGGSSDGIFSLVLEKTKDGWKIIVDNTGA